MHSSRHTEKEARKARHNTVLAHARAYEVYDTQFRHEQNGIIGITLNSEWYHPEDPTPYGMMHVAPVLIIF